MDLILEIQIIVKCISREKTIELLLLNIEFILFLMPEINTKELIPCLRTETDKNVH